MCVFYVGEKPRITKTSISTIVITISKAQDSFVKNVVSIVIGYGIIHHLKSKI